LHPEGRKFRIFFFKKKSEKKKRIDSGRRGTKEQLKQGGCTPLLNKGGNTENQNQTQTRETLGGREKEKKEKQRENPA